MAKYTANEKQFRSDITWLKQNGGKEQNRVQSAIVHIAKHAIEHGNWTALNDLFACHIVEKQRAIKYVRDMFKGLKYDKETNLFIKKSKKTRIEVQTHLFEVHYTDHSNEGTPNLNLDNLLGLNMIEQALKRIETAKEKGAKITGDQAAFIARVNAIKSALA